MIFSIQQKETFWQWNDCPPIIFCCPQVTIPTLARRIAHPVCHRDHPRIISVTLLFKPKSNSVYTVQVEKEVEEGGREEGAVAREEKVEVVEVEEEVDDIRVVVVVVVVVVGRQQVCATGAQCHIPKAVVGKLRSQMWWWLWCLTGFLKDRLICNLLRIDAIIAIIICLKAPNRKVQHPNWPIWPMMTSFVQQGIKGKII